MSLNQAETLVLRPSSFFQILPSSGPADPKSDGSKHSKLVQPAVGSCQQQALLERQLEDCDGQQNSAHQSDQSEDSLRQEPVLLQQTLVPNLT